MYNHYKVEEQSRYFGEKIQKSTFLEPGVYTLEYDDYIPGGWYLDLFESKTEGLIYLPDGPAAHINESVERFLTQETKKAFDRYGLLYKRGVFLYGPPGTGKTVIIHQLSAMAKSKGMIVLMNPAPMGVDEVIDRVREIEGNQRAFMVVWEDLDYWIRRQEAALLNLLDGYNQTDNIFYVATTNYLDDVPPRIRCRPSRFAEVIEVGPPSAEMRRLFFQKKVQPEDNIDLNEWVKKTEGFVIDQLKDVIISVLVLGLTLDDAIGKLKQMQDDNCDESNVCNEDPDEVCCPTPTTRR